MKADPKKGRERCPTNHILAVIQPSTRTQNILNLHNQSRRVLLSHGCVQAKHTCGGGVPLRSDTWAPTCQGLKHINADTAPHIMQYSSELDCFTLLQTSKHPVCNATPASSTCSANCSANEPPCGHQLGPGPLRLLGNGRVVAQSG